MSPVGASGTGAVPAERLTQAQAAARRSWSERWTRVASSLSAPGSHGSGKTEVHLRAAEHALGRGGGALVLVPGALTRSWWAASGVASGARGGPPQRAKDGERLLDWRALRSGAVRLAVGVRSGGLRPGA
jgi:primosomal protein N' (replication factor Y)